ncbi:hypothetical protein DV735_g922, partial [Chaetothyriales sp. CBS 134920]
MPSTASVIYYILHISELRSIVQWKLWHNPVHERNAGQETESERECFRYLDLTSRSFSAVIQELHPELLMPVCVFYLVLRGLDTVEDDTSIPLATKEPILRNFHKNLDVDGWHFDGNRPEEKDRALLVNFRYVVTEFKKQKEAYRDVIADICDKMGNGMADYCANADFNNNGVDKIADYDLYCHYVAGLVGHGLTRMFVEAKLGNPALLSRPNLAESMGRFLQKTNIIRDVREDFDDKRSFWPREIWSKHVDQFEDLFKPENRQLALNCQSEMVLNALNHAEECLFYLAGLREQSVFNFCAIPQAMAIATLELCFQNYSMFERNVKITKGQACQIMIQSTQNLELVCGVFKRHIALIRKKNRPQDPSYLKISLACAKVEQFIESIFPSPKAQLAAAKQPPTVSEPEDLTDSPLWLYIVSFGTFVVIAILMCGVAYLFGARFDVAYNTLKADLIEAFSVLFNHNNGSAKALADAAETLAQTQKSEL